MHPVISYIASALPHLGPTASRLTKRSTGFNMTTYSTLPFDVIHHICSMVWASGNKSLSALSLVDRRTRATCIPFLFMEVVYDRSWSENNLLWDGFEQKQKEEIIGRLMHGIRTKVIMQKGSTLCEVVLGSQCQYTQSEQRVWEKGAAGELYESRKSKWALSSDRKNYISHRSVAAYNRDM